MITNLRLHYASLLLMLQLYWRSRCVSRGRRCLQPKTRTCALASTYQTTSQWTRSCQ